jgi:hypothetical protein
MTLMGDNTVGGVVILRPIKFHFAVVWISVGLLCIYDHMYTISRLPSDLLERKYRAKGEFIYIECTASALLPSQCLLDTYFLGEVQRDTRRYALGRHINSVLFVIKF